MKIATAVAIADFRAGDNVVLAEGPYQSTSGVFLRLKDDIRWAEIEHWNGVIQAHPVEWLRLSARCVPGSPEESSPRKTS
jgi:hypothetical protein